MPVADDVLDLTATDVSEESWELLVADLAEQDPDVLEVMQHPVLTSISPGGCLGCSCCGCCCGGSCLTP